VTKTRLVLKDDLLDTQVLHHRLSALAAPISARFRHGRISTETLTVGSAHVPSPMGKALGN
jgi:hypothetical protein